jgi:hypothetical protein
VEVTLTDDRNLFICIHYISSDINVDTIKNNFHSLENMLDT